jgi:hypothetical protein
MFLPRDTRDQLPQRYAGWLRRPEAQLPRIQAQAAGPARAAAGDIEQIRRLLYGSAA